MTNAEPSCMASRIHTVEHMPYARAARFMTGNNEKIGMKLVTPHRKTRPGPYRLTAGAKTKIWKTLVVAP